MKLILNLEFESLAELDDWLAEEAALRVPAVDQLKPAAVEEHKAARAAEVPAKPKRKRRTKKEMEAARAAIAGAVEKVEVAKADLTPEKVEAASVALDEAVEAVEVATSAKGNGDGSALSLAEQFRDLINDNPKAAIGALDRIIGDGKAFREGTVEQQQAVLTELRGG